MSTFYRDMPISHNLFKVIGVEGSVEFTDGGFRCRLYGARNGPNITTIIRTPYTTVNRSITTLSQVTEFWSRDSTRHRRYEDVTEDVFMCPDHPAHKPMLTLMYHHLSFLVSVKYRTCTCNCTHSKELNIVADVAEIEDILREILRHSSADLYDGRILNELFGFKDYVSRIM